MAKNKRKKTKRRTVSKTTISSIENSRTGGAIALTGFDYQCLYSCYTLLHYLKTESDSIRFEGIEDIDAYISENNGCINHIQVKCSENKQDSSYFKSILQNYLEVYLCDIPNSSRDYILIYDFDVTDGYFKKLIQRQQDEELDIKSERYWKTIVSQIQETKPEWNWANFNFAVFLKHLKFERVKRDTLRRLIERMLIEKYSISTGNEMLYARSLFSFCFSKMRTRQKVTKNKLDRYILEISDMINKGASNPAVHWIKPINFDEIPPSSNEMMYYEGKKASPSDIVAGLPIPRPNIENDIKESIEKNTITVIKSSSGQGKTTLAWRVAYELSNTYSIYQLSWCMESKDLNSIAEYINMRIKLGELPLVILDNLDAQLKEWNLLAQLLQNNLGVNYKILITSRENDWYTYSGDQSNIKKLQVLNIELDTAQAKDIFRVLMSKRHVHSSIINWQSAWEQISGKGLLIEYVYLLTHGEMLADRITAQMKEIESQEERELKFDILRKVCFADTIGIPLSSDKLSSFYSKKYATDISHIVRFFGNEFLISNIVNTVYISGLHPVRSKHLLDFIHQYYPKTDTILDLLDIVEDVYVSKLYSNLPLNIIDEKEEFYQNLVSKTKNKSYKYFVKALRGLFSGSVYKYYQENQNMFDDANQHGGLTIFLLDINPYSRFDKFDTEIQTITSLQKTLPNDENIAYLKSLVDSINKFDALRSDYYIYAYHLYNALANQTLRAMVDGFSDLVYWLTNINSQFNLLSATIISYFWDNRNDHSPEVLADLMLSWYLSDEAEFVMYIEQNREDVFHYLKRITNSMAVFEDPKDNSIHVQYILLPHKTDEANGESVKRLNLICKFIPLYDTYCANAIRPKSDFLESITANVPDSSEKHIPKRNIIISFHKEYAKLWSNTIISNYEAPTVFDWLDFWFSMRQNIVLLWKKNITIIDKKLNQKKIPHGNLSELDELRKKIIYQQKIEYPYPRQNRPFEDSKLPQEVNIVANKYFPYVRNYVNQMVGFLSRTEKGSRLAIFNLRKAKSELGEMQSLFRTISQKAGYYSKRYTNLEDAEKLWVDRLLSYNYYYREHEKTLLALPKQIENWVIKQNKKLLDSVRHAVENNELYSMSFEYPLSRLDDGTLYTLPLISEDIDLEDNDIATGLILSLIPLSTLDVDFIIVIFKAKQTNTVKPSGLRFSKDFLYKAGKVLEKDDASYLEGAFSPFPIEITAQMLEVFSKKYAIKPQLESLNNYDVFFEKLWEYARLNEYIIQPEEFGYLNEAQRKVKNEIEALFQRLNHNTGELFEYATNTKRKVLEEEYAFNNKDFNNAYNMIIQAGKDRKLLAFELG